MYYVYWLKWHYWVNYVLSDSDNPPYNCFKTLKAWGTHEEMRERCTMFARMEGGIWYPRCQSSFVYKGIDIDSQKDLANVMGISTKAMNDRIRAYRLWLRQWPDDLWEIVDGQTLAKPKIVKGRLVGEKEIYEHVLRGW